MADNYGVQVSLKNDLGHMLNVRGQNLQEVGQHLTDMFGEEVARDIIGSFQTRQAVQTVTSGFGGQVQEQAPQAAPQPVQAPAPAAPAPWGAPAPQAQPPAQGAPQPVPQAIPGQGQIPTCTLCGTAKNQVNGKHGLFWSCPNWSNDQHKAAKAQGMKF